MLLIEGSDETHYEVECIRDKKEVKGKTSYLVKWAAYPESDNTWEPIGNLGLCQEKINQFEQGNKEKPKPVQRLKRVKEGGESSRKIKPNLPPPKSCKNTNPFIYSSLVSGQSGKGKSDRTIYREDIEQAAQNRIKTASKELPNERDGKAENNRRKVVVITLSDSDSTVKSSTVNPKMGKNHQAEEQKGTSRSASNHFTETRKDSTEKQDDGIKSHPPISQRQVASALKYREFGIQDFNFEFKVDQKDIRNRLLVDSEEYYHWTSDENGDDDVQAFIGTKFIERVFLKSNK